MYFYIMTHINLTVLDQIYFDILDHVNLTVFDQLYFDILGPHYFDILTHTEKTYLTHCMTKNNTFKRCDNSGRRFFCASSPLSSLIRVRLDACFALFHSHTNAALRLVSDRKQTASKKDIGKNNVKSQSHRKHLGFLLQYHKEPKFYSK